MAADPEITSALDRLADRIDTKVDQLRSESRESSQRIYARIDDHARENRETTKSLTQQLTVVSTQFASHEMQDTTRFNAIDEQLDKVEHAIEDSRQDRGRLWRRLGLAGLVGGGGSVGIIEALRHWIGGAGGQG